MKALKIKSILFSLLAVMAVAVFLTSCEREIIIEEDIEGVHLSSLLAEYPEEITIDNWEEFVYAPQEVMNHFTQKEIEKNKLYLNKKRDSQNSLEKAGPFTGWVKNASNSGQKNIKVSSGLTSSNTSNWGYYALNQSTLGNNLCMEWKNEPNPLYGVTATDLVAIQNHILGLQLFNKLGQYIAADVNGSGSISAIDIVITQKLILGIYSSFPDVDNYVFVNSSDYQAGLNVLSYLHLLTNPNNCDRLYLNNRYVIKKGDVNRHFAF